MSQKIQIVTISIFCYEF